MEEREFYQQLVNRYLAKKLSDEELQVFIFLLQEGKLDVELEVAMDYAAEEFMRQPIVVTTAHNRWWRKPMLVAASLAILAIGGYIINQFLPQNGKPESINYAHHEIAPGRNGATLTLAGAKVVMLSGNQQEVALKNGKIQYGDGSEVLSAADAGTYTGKNNPEMIASTARGQTYSLLLQDGTKVWLNAASSLQFPASFEHKETRTVSLQGEAYFEVAKDKAHPFVVVTTGNKALPAQKLTVLGTHFNINAYADEKTVKTTLLEGSIKIQQSVLKPGEQSVLYADNRLNIADIDPSLAVDWKNGSFIFQGEQIAQLMKRVERWYNVKVIFDDERIGSRTFTGEISRYDNIAELLKILQRTGRVSFQIQGNTIKVSEGNQ